MPHSTPPTPRVGGWRGGGWDTWGWGVGWGIGGVGVSEEYRVHMHTYTCWYQDYGGEKIGNYAMATQTQPLSLIPPAEWMIIRRAVDYIGPRLIYPNVLRQITVIHMETESNSTIWSNGTMTYACQPCLCQNSAAGEMLTPVDVGP